ncbi:MAG: Gfo/Idh/MocA family oxidoreductase, partial [Victivallales bacterium]|nr:Gfo/Idh/MocA family oxidoreductase [Victivallales bacterium]
SGPAIQCTPTSSKKQSGRIVNLAFIGYGIQARTVLVPKMIMQDNVVVKAVCDCDKVRREAGTDFVNEYYRSNKKARLAKCKAVADFRDIIADKGIDAVCIATPDHWHAYICCAAMKAGKDVYCEKPLTYSVEESLLVMKAQKKYHRIFQTGSMQRSWREFRTACMIVRNGFIGKVKYVDCNYGNASAQDNTDYAKFPANHGGPSQPHRFFCQWNSAEGKPQDIATESAPNPDVDWDMWLGPAPWSPYSDQCAPRGVNKFYPMFWRIDDNYAIGYNGDWGAHHLDIAQWGLDLDESGPVKIICSDEPHSVNPFHGGRRQFGMKFVFADGTILTHHAFGAWGTVFYGTKGIVAVNRGRIAVWLGKGVKPTAQIRAALEDASFDKMKKIASSIGEEYGTDPNQKKDNRLALTLDTLESYFKLDDAPVQLYKSLSHEQNFIECCVSRKPTIAPASVGGRSAILCQLCNISYVYDVSFDWDPVKCTFANGTGDPAWLKRPYNRNGWDIRL